MVWSSGNERNPISCRPLTPQALYHWRCAQRQIPAAENTGSKARIPWHTGPPAYSSSILGQHQSAVLNLIVSRTSDEVIDSKRLTVHHSASEPSGDRVLAGARKRWRILPSGQTCTLPCTHWNGSRRQLQVRSSPGQLCWLKDSSTTQRIDVLYADLPAAPCYVVSRI